MLRADLTQIDDRDQWLGVVGFLYLLHKNWALESWICLPTDRGNASFTVKLNYIIKL